MLTIVSNRSNFAKNIYKALNYIFESNVKAVAEKSKQRTQQLLFQLILGFDHPCKKPKQGMNPHLRV